MRLEKRNIRLRRFFLARFKSSIPLLKVMSGLSESTGILLASSNGLKRRSSVKAPLALRTQKASAALRPPCLSHRRQGNGVGHLGGAVFKEQHVRRGVAPPRAQPWAGRVVERDIGKGPRLVLGNFLILSSSK